MNTLKKIRQFFEYLVFLLVYIFISIFPLNIASKIIGTLMSRNYGGSIVNISSDLGLIAPNQNLYKKDNLNDNEQFVKPISYSVVKSGLIGMTRYTSTYWPLKVRCNCLCPGGIYTNQPQNFLNK